MDNKAKSNNDMTEPIECICKKKDGLVFTQKLKRDYSNEIKDSFETIGIVVRAKINRLCNEHKYEEAKKLENALIEINNSDYNH